MTLKTLHLYGLPLGPIGPALAEAFPDMAVEVIATEDELEAVIGEIEVLFAMRPPKGLWAGASKLRLIQTIGAGVDAVLPALDLSKGVKITNARGVHRVQMGEFALAMMLSFAKDLPRLTDQQAKREWAMFFPESLSGATCGILGLGTIGEAIAQRAKAMGMTVIGTQRTPKPSEFADKVFPPEETGEVMAQADYVVVVLPLTPDTQGLLDKDMLARMKSGAVLINLSRGGVMDEDALAALLRDGKIKGAAVDVFAEEPLPKDSPLWDIPGLIVSPHMAAATTDYFDKVCAILCENIRRLDSGETLVNEIDRNRGY